MCYQQNRSRSLVTITDGMNLVQKMRIEKTRPITQIDRPGGALQEYSSETWRQVTGSVIEKVAQQLGP